MPTEIGLDRITTICSTRHPANVLGGIFLQWMRNHFSDVSNLEYNGENEFANDELTQPLSELQDYIWAPNNKDDEPVDTKILIQMVWDYDPQNIQQRPGIFVKRNKQQAQKIAINNGFTSGSIKNPDGSIKRVPGEFNTQLILGSHTLFCVGNSGAQAELIGAEVFNELLAFGPMMRDQLKLQSLQIEGIEEVALLDEFDEHFVVPIVVTYAYARSWRVDLVAPFLKTLSINVNPVN